MISIALLFAFLLTDVAPPVVTVSPSIEVVKPTEVKAKPGRSITLKAETAGKSVLWVPASESDVDLIPSADGKSCVFVASVPGRYLLLCYSAVGDVPTAPTKVLVIVGDAPVAPPGPVNPPAPTDPFIVKLQAAYNEDTLDVVKKASALADLVELYRQAQAMTKDPDLETIGMVIGKVRAAAKLLSLDGLKGVRTVIADDLKVSFPDDQPLTEDLRYKLALQYLKIYASLKNVK